MLPPPVTWERLAAWVRMFSADRDWEGIEQCLMTARGLGGCDDRILPLAFTCALEPHFIGFGFNIIHLVRLGELLDEFGWDVAEQLVCNLVAKMLGRHRGTPDGVRREAIAAYAALQADLGAIAEPAQSAPLDEDARSAKRYCRATSTRHSAQSRRPCSRASTSAESPTPWSCSRPTAWRTRR